VEKGATGCDIFREEESRLTLTFFRQNPKEIPLKQCDRPISDVFPLLK
jgi:hypothetical protein